ncbi:MAG: DUF1566 domain-containing protein, partial [Candidatus Methylumidiphilus sp.]
QEIFAVRGRTFTAFKSIEASLEGKGCDELKIESHSNGLQHGNHHGGFAIFNIPIIVHGATREAITQAVASCQRLADAGDANAMAWMGEAIRQGLLFVTDLQKRDQWYMKAARAGNQYASYALVAFATKRTLADAQEAVKKYGPQWDVDTRLAARYNLAMASEAPSTELDDIMQKLKQRPDVWQTNWVQVMLRNLVEEKKVKELEPGDALRAYATQIELIDANGKLKPDWNYNNERSTWFKSKPWSWGEPLNTLDDEDYYAMRVTESSAWTRGETSGFQRVLIPEKIIARPLALAVKPGSPPIAVGENVLLPSGTVQQKSKQLEWMPCSRGQTWDGQRRNCHGDELELKHDELAATIQKINAGAGQYGHTDWRLPTLLELHGLIQCRNGIQTKDNTHSHGMDLTKCKLDPLLRSNVSRDLFPQLSGSHWTSTPVNKKSGKWFTIRPDSGWLSEWGDSNDKNRALLVRDTR